MNTTYSPELDVLKEIKEDDVLISRNSWSPVMGNKDWKGRYIDGSGITLSIQSEYQILHIFAFLQKHPKLTLYMSPELPMIDYVEFCTNKNDFVEIYRDAVEQLPHWMPAPRGRSLTMIAFVDASQLP
jgi:hypothetical protein